MMSHKNSKLTARGRLAMVKRLEAGESGRSVARDLGLAVSNVYRWWARYRAEGDAGLADRSSRPHEITVEMPPALKDLVEALRRKRWTYAKIAIAVGRSPSAVARVAQERGVARLDRLDPREPVIRYERARPGELVHFDIKKLGRIEYVGHRITGNRGGYRHGRKAGSSRTLRSTMRREARTSRFCRTSKDRRQKRLPSVRWHGSLISACASSES